MIFTVINDECDVSFDTNRISSCLHVTPCCYNVATRRDVSVPKLINEMNTIDAIRQYFLTPFGIGVSG